MTAVPPKTCSHCGTLHHRAQRYCAPCHTSYMRKWRQDHPHMTNASGSRAAVLRVVMAALSGRPQP